MAEHKVTVKLNRGYDEWTPVCVCNWVGSYWPKSMKAEATREGADHEAGVGLAGSYWKEAEARGEL